MIPFKGRLSFKQYMKDKPVKHGIKVFVLAMAVASGPVGPVLAGPIFGSS